MWAATNSPFSEQFSFISNILEQDQRNAFIKVEHYILIKDFLKKILFIYS